jgi:hypothetical protein
MAVDTDDHVASDAAYGSSADSSPSDAFDRSLLETVHAAVDLLGRGSLADCGPSDLDRMDRAAQRMRGFLAASDVQRARRREEIWRSPEPDPPGGEGGGDGGDGGRGDDPTGGAGGGDDGDGDGDGHGEPNGGAGGGDDGGGGGGGGGGDDGDGDGDGEPNGGSPGGDDPFGRGGGRRSGNDSARDHTRAAAIATMPSFEAALAAGEIDVAHVDALAAALARFDTGHPDDRSARHEFVAHEAELLHHARAEAPERFRRRCLDLSRRIARDHGLRVAERQKRDANIRSWVDKRSGMGHIHLTLEPGLYDASIKALDDQLARLRAADPNSGVPWQRLRVDAFAQLLTHSGAHHQRSAEIVVLVDHDTLRDGVFGTGSVCESIDGNPLHPATVRRLACDAALIPAVLGGDGVPLDLGRSRRLASAEQRTALASMYATCAHPDCSVPFRRCRIHHLDPWHPDGETNLDRLIPLCERNHHDVHEGGWTLTMTPDRVISLYTPGGTHWFTGDTRDRPAPDAASTCRRPGRDAPTPDGATATNSPDEATDPALDDLVHADPRRPPGRPPGRAPDPPRRPDRSDRSDRSDGSSPTHRRQRANRARRSDRRPASGAATGAGRRHRGDRPSGRSGAPRLFDDDPDDRHEPGDHHDHADRHEPGDHHDHADRHEPGDHG